MVGFSENMRVLLIWILLFAGFISVVVFLDQHRTRLLGKIGDSAPSSSIVGGDDFLEIKSAYTRVLERYHQNAGSEITGKNLAQDADFKILVEKMRNLRKSGNRPNNPQNQVALDLILSDALWMAGQSANAKKSFSQAMDQAGLALNEKNLLTRKVQNRQSIPDLGPAPE